MAGRGIAFILGELAKGTLRLSDVGAVLGTFAICTAVALAIVASNIDKPNRDPLEMSPWSGWLLAGILVAFCGTALWVYPQPHAIRAGIIAAALFVAVFLAIYRVARVKGWTRG
jgi:hypothetical protein